MARLRSSSIRCLFLLALISLILKESTSQVDNSKALIWTTRVYTGELTFTIFYGDPLKYVPDLMNNRSGSYGVKSLKSDIYGNGFGAVDVRFADASFYFCANKVLGYSPQLIITNGSNDSYTYWTMGVPAVSNQVNGLSVDWVSGNLYWSDGAFQSIRMVDIATTLYWRSVIDTNLTSPQDVAVYPQKNILFWIDLGSNPKIERFDLINDVRTVIVSNGILQQPKTLAIDFANQRLYWLDPGKNTIGSVNIDGSGISQWTLSVFSSYSSFVIYKDYIFLGSSSAPTFYVYNVTQRQYLTNITAVANQLGFIDMTMWSQGTQQTVSSPCTSGRGGCGHLCLTINSTARRCLCATGFFLGPDGTSCVTRPLQTSKFLMATDKGQKNIFQIDFDSGDIRALLDAETLFPTAMTYDSTCGCIYMYSFDRRNQYIFKKAVFDNSQKTVIASATGVVLSLAVDTNRRTLFYSEQLTQTIVKISLSTQQTSTFLSEPSSSPTAIVLDTYNSMIYWSDCTSWNIQRSSVSSAVVNRSTVVSGLSSCATTFTIDFNGGIIYWADESGSILFSYLDGSSRRTILSDPNAVYNGLALDARFIYVADSNKNQIRKLDRVTFQIANLTKNLFTEPFALVYYSNDSLQTTTTTTTTTTTSTTTMATTTTTSTATTTTGLVSTTASSTTSNWLLWPAASPTITTTTLSSSSQNTPEPQNFTTIILACVISGSVILIVIIVTIGVVSCRKRSRKHSSSPQNIYDTVNPPYQSIIPPPSTSDRVMMRPTDLAVIYHADKHNTLLPNSSNDYTLLDPPAYSVIKDDSPTVYANVSNSVGSN